MPRQPKPCIEAGCDEPKHAPWQRCAWHWLAKQPIELQERAAQRRLERATATGPYRQRVPQAQWPDNGRWCSGCQSFVPLFYVSGSRCRACNRRAARASHVERTYDITGAEEAALRAWQGNRCFVCGRRAVTRQLAVDHDHTSGAVRGLLCSDDDHGCNVLLRRILDDPAAAARLLLYVQRWPLERFRAGEPAPF